MKKPSVAQIVGVFIMLACFVLFLFFQMTRDAGKRADENPEKTELDKLLEYDMEKNYPKTVRDVIKLHCRYLTIVFDEDTKDEDLDQLNKKMRMLYAKDLLAYNDEAAQLASLKAEVLDYRNEDMYIIGYTMSEASQIVYDTIDEQEFAKIEVSFNVKTSVSSVHKEETFVLIKENNQWKIYGWASEEEEMKAEE